MARSLGTLTLDLVAKTGGYVAGLSKAERESEKWRRKVKQQVSDVSKTFAKFGAIAAAGAATGLIAITKNTIDSAREIQNLSRVANTSAEDFQRITFAADKYGVAQEKVADILKDVSDKVGDFLQTGGGPLADFFENIAPQVGVTAEQFRNLSGPEALGLYISSLEKANVSQNEMTFFMEAIASDATLLLPLLKNNGAEFARLADQADKFGVVLSDIDIQRLEEVRQKIDETKGVFQGLSNEVALGALPVIEELTELLGDEQTIEAARALGQAVAASFQFATEAIRDTINTVKFLAEEFAAIRVGIARDDIARLEREAEKIRGILSDGDLFDKIVWFGRDGIVTFTSDDDLRAELAKIESALDAYYNNSQNRPKVKVDIEADLEALFKNQELFAFDDARPQFIMPDKEAQEEMKKLNSAYESYLKKLQSSNQLTQEATELDRLKFELQSGGLQGLNEAKQKELEQLAREVDLKEEIANINEEALSIQESLRTEEESISESYARRREIILKNTEVTGKAQQELLARLDKERDEALANTSAKSEFMSVIESLKSEEEKLIESYDRRRKIILENTEENELKRQELLAKLQTEFNEDLLKLEEDRMDEMSKFAERAAENMQDAFADFLFDPFEDGLDGMLKSFGQTLQRMVAEAASAQIFEALGIEDLLKSKVSDSGGLFGGILGKIGAGTAGEIPGVRGPDFNPYAGKPTASSDLEVLMKGDLFGFPGKSDSGIAGAATDIAAESASTAALTAAATALTGSATALTGSATALSGSATALTAVPPAMTAAFTTITTSMAAPISGLTAAATALTSSAAALSASAATLSASAAASGIQGASSDLEVLMKAGDLFGFSGGGYTGSAPRAGGLDGQGGFLAMVHPQETIIDHTAAKEVMPKNSGGTTNNITLNYQGTGDVEKDRKAMGTMGRDLLNVMKRSQRYG